MSRTRGMPKPHDKSNQVLPSKATQQPQARPLEIYAMLYPMILGNTMKNRSALTMPTPSRLRVDSRRSFSRNIAYDFSYFVSIVSRALRPWSRHWCDKICSSLAPGQANRYQSTIFAIPEKAKSISSMREARARLSGHRSQSLDDRGPQGFSGLSAFADYADGRFLGRFLSYSGETVLPFRLRGKLFHALPLSSLWMHQAGIISRHPPPAAARQRASPR